MTADRYVFDRITHRLLQAGFISFALFAPFSIAGMTISMGLVAIGWLGNAISCGGSAPVQHDALLWPAIALAVLALPSVLLSVDSARAFSDWRSYWQLLIYFGVAGYLVRTGMRERVVHVLAFATILSCAVAFTQRAGGLHWGPVHIGAEHRVSSTLFTMTFAGILAQLVLFFATTVWIRTYSIRSRAVFAVTTLMALAALLLTMTRGAWIAVAAGGMALCLILRRKKLIAATLVGAITMGVFAIHSGRDQGRTFSPSAIVHSAPDRNVHTRLVLWRVAWDLFVEHPVLGVGMGDYTIEANRLVREHGDRGVLTTVDAHNVCLQVLATRGLVGFIPFAAFWIMVFVVLVRTMRSFPNNSAAHLYAAGLIAVTVVLLVGSLTEDNIDDEEVLNVYLFLLGLARSVEYGRARHTVSSIPAPPPQPQITQ